MKIPDYSIQHRDKYIKKQEICFIMDIMRHL